MAITIIQEPTGYISAHDALWHVVESTNRNIAGFQYIFDIYKDDVLLTRVKNAPYSGLKYGILNVGNIVRSTINQERFRGVYIHHEYNATFNYFTISAKTEVYFTEYNVRFGESTGTTIFPDIASGTYRAYNNYKTSRWSRQNSDISGNVFLTNRPRPFNYYKGHPIVFSVYPLLNQGEDNAIQLFYVNPPDNLLNGEILSYGNLNTFGFVPTGTNSYIEMYENVDFDEILIERIYLKQKCSKYKCHTIVFMNAYGGYDSATFVHGKLLMDNDKKKFEQSKWQINPYLDPFITDKTTWFQDEAGAFQSIVYNEGNKVYANTYKEKMELTSDLLSTEEYLWLGELINSTMVHYYDVDKREYYPVTITNNNYEYKNSLTNKSETLTITIEFGTTQNAQYR